MKIIIYPDGFEDAERPKCGKGLKIFLCILCVCLVACTIVCAALGHWADIKALFAPKEEAHVHMWSTAVVKVASCEEDGVALHRCECGEEKQAYLYAYGHNLVNGFCVDCGREASKGLAVSFHTDEDGKPYAVIEGKGTCADRNLVIPNVVGGIPVREIAANAFKKDVDIRSVAIAEGIEKLGEYAFEGCKDLYSIVLPENTEVAFGAFFGTAYYNDSANWQENRLYLRGRLLLEMPLTKPANS